MIHAVAVTDWAGTVAWFFGLAAAAFLVSWLLTDVLRVARRHYVGALTAVTAALTAGYLVWSGNGSTFWTDGWVWGLIGAVVAGAFLALMLRHVREEHGERSSGMATVLWETVIYGTAEGLLLSALPVVMIWAAFDGAGWTSGWLAVAAGAAAMFASLFVIVVHHMGYSTFRSRRMAQPLTGCLLLSLAYLLTGSPLAPVVGHIILHAAMLRRGMELPPEATAPSTAKPRLRVAA